MNEKPNSKEKRKIKQALLFQRSVFQRSVLQGLGVALPPLLTIVILLWIFNTVQVKVLRPIEGLTNQLIGWTISETVEDLPEDAKPENGQVVLDGEQYVQIENGSWLPNSVVVRVKSNPGESKLATSKDYYLRYSEITFFSRFIIPPIFLIVFILILYLLGRFIAYGMGRFLYRAAETMITQVPIIRTVYASVKQVTDFVFSEKQYDFNRVVAVEYPRKGMWSLGFVTGESMLDLRNVAQEPVVSVLMPTSPMPATGFTVTVRKSETVELDISVDQAIQFIVSCGVVVPLPQRQDAETDEIQATIENSVISHA